MASHTNNLARYLFNQWRNTLALATHLYEEPVDDKKLRAARQALSRLREAIKQENWPIEVPAGRRLVLDERWEHKADGRGSEKSYRLRLVDCREDGGAKTAEADYVQLWVQPYSWMGWVVPGFSAMERDRLISHKHLYAASRGPDNWLTVAGSDLYRQVDNAAGEAAYGELYGATGGTWAGGGDLVYIGLGAGSGLADVRVVRELLEQNKARCVRAVALDFSPVLLSVAVSNFYQEFDADIRSGRLSVHPILGDLERPEEWARLLPPIEADAALLIGMFGNTIGHLQYRERQTLQRIMEELDEWAKRSRHASWTQANSRFLLGVSILRKDGAPHGRDEKQAQKWLNFIADPLRDLLETQEGEYETIPLPADQRDEVDGRRAVAEIRLRGRKSVKSLGRVWHEELPYKPADGITGVVQRYFFLFEQDLRLVADSVFTRHHLPKGLWQDQDQHEARFEGGVDQVVLCEVTQFNLNTLRPALRRMGVAHGESQIYRARVGNIEPYAVLAFARV
ncbi:MAG TPA: hypothetical protein VGC54_10220 [Planctomycetota bacterium]